MKQKRKFVVFAMAVCMLAVFLCAGCGKKTEAGDEEKGTAVEESEDAKIKRAAEEEVSHYLNKNLKTDFKAFTDIEDVLPGADDENALMYVSGDINSYVKAGDIEKEAAASFSDTFAKSLTENGAVGSLSFHIHLMPDTEYDSINEENHVEAAKKAEDKEEYRVYGFKIGGRVNNEDK